MILILHNRHFAISKMVRPNFVCRLRPEKSSKMLKGESLIFEAFYSFSWKHTVTVTKSLKMDKTVLIISLVSDNPQSCVLPF